MCSVFNFKIYLKYLSTKNIFEKIKNVITFSTKLLCTQFFCSLNVLFCSCKNYVHNQNIKNFLKKSIETLLNKFESFNMCSMYNFEYLCANNILEKKNGDCVFCYQVFVC